MINSYVFISSYQIDIFQKASNLLSDNYKSENLKKNPNQDTIIYFNKKESDIIYYSSQINDFHQKGKISSIVDIEKGIVGSKNDYSLYSFAWIKDKSIFCCNSDYLGVFTHYYYHINDTLIVSDNLSLIANLTNSHFSEEGIFDAVLFKKPFGVNTWYKNIYCLSAGSILCFNLNNLKLSKYGSTNFSDFLSGNKLNMIETFSCMFPDFQNNETILLSLSAGSDSRSILAGLLNRKLNFKAYSWGDNNYLETNKIKPIVSKFNLDWELLDFNKLEEYYISFHNQAIFFSSGLIPAIHHFYYRSCLPKGSILYEGYGGSEFIKGEHSDGMFTKIFKSIIKDNLKLKDALSIYLKGLPKSLLVKITDYLSEYYGNLFINIDTEKGKDCFQHYLLKFIPSKIFSGIFKSSEVFNLKLIEPYFSPAFLASVFANSMGIKQNLSLRKDFAGPIKSIKPQAISIKELHPVIYTTLLDRNIKFSECNYPSIIIKPLRRIRQQLDKILMLKYNVKSQVNYNSFKGQKEVIKNRKNITDLISTWTPFTPNSNFQDIEIYLTALNFCSKTEFIKKAISI